MDACAHDAAPSRPSAPGPTRSPRCTDDAPRRAAAVAAPAHLHDADRARRSAGGCASASAITLAALRPDGAARARARGTADGRAVAAADGDRRQRHRAHRRSSSREGLVERAPRAAATGARTPCRLTAAGRAAFAAMAAEHERWIVELTAGLDAAERAAAPRAARRARRRRCVRTRPTRRRRRAMTHDAGRRPFADYRATHFRCRGERRRQGRDDHAQPPGAQESADVRLVRGAARPVPRPRLRERRARPSS